MKSRVKMPTGIGSARRPNPAPPTTYPEVLTLPTQRTKSSTALTRFGVVTAAVALLTGSTISTATAADLDVRDKKRDAAAALDITRVTVSHSDQAVRVVVQVRDFAKMDSAAKVPTALGVHFDTKGDKTPDHLIKMDGMHVAAGSTRDWNQLRPNGADPWGDWTDCFPKDWETPLIKTRPGKDTVTFTAPRTCLGKPDKVRVAIQSYKPYRTDADQDWAPSARRYLASVALN